MPPLTAKNQFLGSLLPSTSMKTTTASTTAKTGLSSLVTPSSPAATSPTPVTAPKSQFVSSVANSAPPVMPGTVNTQPNPQPGPIKSPNVTTPSGAIVDPNSGALVAQPPSNPDQNYADAFQAYLNTLMPSDAETNATKFLNDLTLQQQKDQETALSRGETLGFATGEAARVNKNNAFQIDAASNALNAITGKRTAATTATKARMDYEASLKKDNKGFDLSAGETHYEYDPATKTYKQVAAGPAKANDPLDEEYKRAQIKNIQSEIDKRTRDSAKDGQYTIPSANRNNLLKFGLKTSEVDALQKDIRDYGLAKALEGIDDQTKSIITTELDKLYQAQ